MPWSVQLLPGRSVVETVYAGLLSAEELRAAVEATLKLSLASGTATFLGDCSALKGGHSVFDLYELAKVVATLPNKAQFREALLIAPDTTSREDVEFWETTCINRGLKVRLFENRDEALAWLAR